MSVYLVSLEYLGYLETPILCKILTTLKMEQMP